MSRVITATGMALLSIGIVTAVHAKPASQAGHVKVGEVAQADGQSGNAPAARGRGPKEKTKELVGRHRGGPKDGGRDKILTGITEGPGSNDAQAAKKGRGPKEKMGIEVGIAEGATPIDTTAEARRKEGPKGDVDHGVTDTGETAEVQPTERRKGPKGRSGSDAQGQMEAPLLDDGPLAEKKRGPKARDKIDTGLTEVPSTDAARTGRPRIKTKTAEDTGRASDPAASTDHQPVAKKRRGPKIKEKTATND